jgi:hypothetical protein
LRLVSGFDRFWSISCAALFWVPLRFRLVSLIQRHALHHDDGDSTGGSEIKLVPPRAD